MSTSPIVDVLDYGAPPATGVVPNLREKIVAALTDPSINAPAWKRTLFLPAREYELEGMLSNTIGSSQPEWHLLKQLRIISDGAVIRRSALFPDRFFIHLFGAGVSLSVDGKLTFDGGTTVLGNIPDQQDLWRAAIFVLGEKPTDSGRADGIYIGPEVQFTNLTWQSPIHSLNVDHGVVLSNARNVEVHCRSQSVRGWTVWLEVVDDFLVSNCRLTGNHWGGIQLRKGCRRGVVTHNHVWNAYGLGGSAIDMLGESVLANADLGIPQVLNERVLIAENHVECQAAYGGALRVKACRMVDVVGNTVEVFGTTPPGVVRYGIFVGNKEFTDAPLAAQSNCEHVRVVNNRVIARATLEGAVYGMNNNATTNVPNRNIAFVGNQLVEAEGRFRLFGIRYGQDLTNSGKTEGLTIRSNYGRATLDAGTGTGIGALVVAGHGTDATRGIVGLEVEDNTLRSSAATPTGSAGGVSGTVSSAVYRDNTFTGYSSAFVMPP
jgi:hypothetical protein